MTIVVLFVWVASAFWLLGLAAVLLWWETRHPRALDRVLGPPPVTYTDLNDEWVRLETEERVEA